jgi:hypothetical protein
MKNLYRNITWICWVCEFDKIKTKTKFCTSKWLIRQQLNSTWTYETYENRNKNINKNI